MPKNQINRRSFLKYSMVGSAFLATPQVLKGKFPAIVENKTPNILLILTDQQHSNALSFFGNTNLSTPAIDYLYKNGVSFNNNYCTNPICSPARSSLFTGRMPSETGVWKNGNGIDKSIPNLGQWFNERSDYKTYYAGKWHLPNGFTFNIPGFNVLTPGVSFQGILGDSVTSEACANFISNYNEKNPFLLVASFLQPHDICQWLRLNAYRNENVNFSEPLPNLPDNFRIPEIEHSSIRQLRESYEPIMSNWTEDQWRYYLYNYYRQVEMVDAEVGKIISSLIESEHHDNTLVLFTSDHGEGLAHHKFVRKNTLYEESIKTPFSIYYPNEIPGNKRSDNLTSGLDIFPTLCEFAKIKSPEKLKGVSLKPNIDDKNNGQREFVIGELSTDGDGITLDGRMVRTNKYKLITFNDGKDDQLFDIINDKYEMKNIANEIDAQNEKNELKRILKKWESKIVPSKKTPARKIWNNRE
ncbi:MAG: sulfatase-like hydrolase/transferase [Melioribacteraceae bacterium]|nr:sulfatase-like hydrolase/transferase [Melioribacteraceae bacterium]MCF8262898.1 sulfatase-like hydrolase/transferase [Melioribacteraceae bacterium]